MRGKSNVSILILHITLGSDDFFDYISSEEKIRTAKEILVFLYTLDDQHVIEHLKRDLNGKTLNDVQTDLETWKQEILSLISLDE
jgi:hypothetical protein